MFEKNKILRKIFHILHEDALITDSFCNLHSCILVSKIWLDNTIPVLWSTFKSSKSSIIETLLSCCKDSPKKLQQSKAAFNYLSFINNIYYSDLNLAVYNWSKKETTHNHGQFAIGILQSILKSYTDSGATLKSLEIEIGKFQNCLKDQFIPEFSKLISNLEKLVIEVSNKEDKLLAELSKNSIEIRLEDRSFNEETISENVQNICALISQQKALETLKLSFCKLSVQQIISVIEKQADTLRVVEFWFVDFSRCEKANGLIACKNLEKLVFKHCRNCSLEFCTAIDDTEFDDTKFDKLECAEIDDTVFPDGSLYDGSAIMFSYEFGTKIENNYNNISSIF
ncbi:16212_t:CDS:2 [Dentiscutata erythropus]|uniref:16212_t:CDS:1 n=1 Tax=Dentiscutata erythropus TaxID=1348616 RepID=A0A9N8V969_9GLOM|nr:16212_t:CDS:2 [Dentiscutata erythropus]